MYFNKSALSFSSIVFFGLSLMVFASCKKDECKDAVCAPCPSSRFVMEYQDSTGACPSGFHASAKVYAISAEDPTDTAYVYNFSDSCRVGFLVDENMVYHVRASSPTVHDVLYFAEYEYQEPLNVTDCCLCYPISKVSGVLNGDSVKVDYPTGKYENTGYVRILE